MHPRDELMAIRWLVGIGVALMAMSLVLRYG